MFDTVRRKSFVPMLCLILLAAGTLVSPAAAAPPPAKTQAPASPVDINAAGEQELQGIPGIGEVTARLIVEWREANGPFRRVEDLMKVKGIGEKSLEKLRPFVKVGQEK